MVPPSVQVPGTVVLKPTLETDAPNEEVKLAYEIPIGSVVFEDDQSAVPSWTRTVERIERIRLGRTTVSHKVRLVREGTTTMVSVEIRLEARRRGASSGPRDGVAVVIRQDQ